MSDFKPILCIDFDGVIHSYERGWQNGEIYGTVTPGFFDWAWRAHKLFTLTVYSSRSKTEGGRDNMQRWINDRMTEWKAGLVAGRLPADYEDPFFQYAAEKPPAWLTIDDRAVCFKGSWKTDDLSPWMLRTFKPWNAVDYTPPKKPNINDVFTAFQTFMNEQGRAARGELSGMIEGIEAAKNNLCQRLSELGIASAIDWSELDHS